MISPSTMALLPGIGSWRAAAAAGPAWEARGLAAALTRVREPVHVVRDGASGAVGLGLGGELVPPQAARAGDHPLLATLPALYPEWLGDRSFCEAHGVRFPYVAGEMANGIATTRDGRSRWRRPGCSASSAPPASRFERVEQAIDELERRAAAIGAAWGVNLIHSPERARARGARSPTCSSRRGVRAHLGLGVHGADAGGRALRRGAGCALDADGRDRAAGTTSSRRSPAPEVARAVHVAGAGRDARARWSSAGCSPQDEAELAARVPVAEDITVEADCGGHTDNRPLAALLPDDPRAPRRARGAARLRAADPRRRGRRARHAGGASRRRSRSAPPTCSPARSTRRASSPGSPTRGKSDARRRPTSPT